MYFPEGDSWEKSSLSLPTEQEKELFDYLEQEGTRAFILLHEGRIVSEKYFGKDLLTGNSFNQNSLWYWASAGKTLTAFTVGLAEEQGFLKITDRTSAYLGEGWTSLEKSKEQLITIKNQLSMTTGLKIGPQGSSCMKPACLTYLADAGTRWEYHNAPYTLLESVVSTATNSSFNTFFNTHLRDKIGMDGQWRFSGDNNVYYSTPRSMARFGLLILNQGTWKDQKVMRDTSYFKQMLSTSQNLNLSYGYLWWLNGKESILYPGIPIKIPKSLSPSAPSDLIAAMGKNGQLLNVVPSKGLVLVRMGDAEEDDNGILLQEEIWQRLNPMLPL